MLQEYEAAICVSDSALDMCLSISASMSVSVSVSV